MTPSAYAAYTPLDYMPIGGVNSEDSEDLLDRGEVQDARNLLFERRQARTRPAMRDQGTNVTPAGALLDVISMNITGTSRTTGRAFILHNNPQQIMLLDTGGDLAGAAIVFGNLGSGPNVFFGESVNGVALLGNNPGGLVRWVLGAGAYTIIATAPFRYVTGLLSRAVAAFDISGAAGGPQTIGWSVPGDETTWTGATNGSGRVILSNINDVITGIFNLHNVIVAPREFGFTLGYPTGLAFPAFRFESWSSSIPGCVYPKTAAVHNNTLYYVGQDDIYTFDLQNITPIGYKVRSSLLSKLRAGNISSYVGFITYNTQGGRPRPQYHLFPSANDVHYVYDIRDGVWSLHDYAAGIAATKSPAFSFADGSGSFGVGSPAVSFLSTVASPNHLYQWDDSQPCERDAYIKLPDIVVGADDIDYTLERLLIRCRDYGAATVANVVITAKQGNAVSTLTKNNVPIGSALADGSWLRSWVDGQLVGNDFTIKITFPSTNATRAAINRVRGQFGTAAIYRG